MTVREYYLLEADSIRGNVCMWWKPNGQGYTANLNKAGVYTETEARAHERASDSAAIAVHRFEAWDVATATVDGGRLRETGALAAFDLRCNVEDAWRGRPLDNGEAAAFLNWSEELDACVRRWHSTSVHRRAEWARVAETVKFDEAGRCEVQWPAVEVSLEETTADDDGETIGGFIARAEIGGIKLSETGHDRASASANLVEAARVRGQIERGEPG